MSTRIIIPRPPEFKAVSYQVKTTDDKRGIIEGFLNVIGNIDDGNDRTMPNAFKKTLNDSYAHKSAQSLEYLFPYLWNHDPDEPPIGGIFDADEVKAKGNDPAGLFIKTQLILDIERARNVYSCFKGDTSNTGLLKQSMGYKTIRYEWVEEKGQRVRNLLEVALWEGSAVVFPMNDLSVVTAVKSMDTSKVFTVPDLSGVESMEEKGASGKTTWPLADKDTKWSGSQAKKDIQEWATEGDEVNWSKAAQCFFWIAKSPPEKLADCKFPFVAKDGGTMKAIPQGIISGAGIIMGAMGGANIDDVEGVKSKIATYYKKMDMTPPWEDDSKRNGRMKERKDFNTLFQATQAQDALEDWGDLVNTLTQAMMEAFCIGDQPQADMSDVLDQFGEAVGKWTGEAVESGLPALLSGRYGASSPYVPYSLRVGGYDSMSKDGKPDIKVGARISEDTKAVLDEHVNTVKDVSKKMKNMSDDLAQHSGTLEKKANDLTELYKQEGQGPAFANDKSDTGKSNISQQDNKSKDTESDKRREPPPALTREKQPPTSTEITLDDLEALLV